MFVSEKCSITQRSSFSISGGDADDKLDKLTLGIAPTVSPHLLSTIQKKVRKITLRSTLQL